MAITLLVDPFGAHEAAKSLATSSRKRPRGAETIIDLSRPDKKQRLVRKCVCFNDIVNVAVVDRVDESEAANVWFSKEDLREAVRRDQRDVARLTPSYAEVLVDVLEAVTASSNTQLTPHCRAALAEIRGLERDMLPCFRQRRRRVMQNVLNSQTSLVAWKKANPDKPSHHTIHILATHCKKLSRPAQRFARLLAQADATAAL